jgi:WD40 repeat protein
MATPGTVPNLAASGSGPRRCPLCSCELVLSTERSGCPSCGFDVGQVGAARRQPEAVAAAPASAKPLDPLDRWLAGETIQPNELSDRDRVANWLRRHPRAAAIAGAVLLATVVLPIGSLVAFVRSNEAVRAATAERAAAEQKQQELSAAAAETTDELKSRDARLEHELRDRQALEKSLEQLNTQFAASEQQRLAAEARVQDELRAARRAMAEDFTRQAEELKQGMPEISLVLAAKALSITQQDGMPPIPTALQQVRDLLAPTDGIELRGHDGPVAQLAASRDGSWLASGDHQGLIRLWSTATRDAIQTPRILDGHWGRITQLVFTADNRWLASGSTDSTVHLWQLDASETNKAPLLLKNRQGRFASLAVSEDGRWLAIAGAGHVTNDVFVRLWDLRAEDILSSSIDLPTYQGQLCSLAVGRNGEWIATGNEDGAVRLWRISNLTHTVTATDLRMHNEPVRAIRFAPDGKSLIAAAGRGSGKGTVRAWGLHSSDASIDAVLADSERGVELFTLSPDGRWLFTADQTPSLRVRDLTKLDGEQGGAAVEGQTCAVQAMVVSANNRWLATAGTDNVVRLWYIGPTGPTATPITIRAPYGVVTGIAFAGKGDWLATGNDRGNVQLWNLQVDDLIRMANLRMLK